MSGLPDSASRTIRPFLGCATVAFLEGYDIQSVGVAAPRVAQAFDLAPLGWLFSASLLGIFVGAIPGAC